MKIKQICIITLLFWGMASIAKAQTFDKLWKQVEQAEKKSLPQTVIQLTGEIYQKAEAEKNSPQMLKAYTWRMKYREMLTPDSFYVSVKGLEQWAETAEKPIDRAVLHSLLAGIYSDYASANRWQLRQQPQIIDETPSADMREWTGNMFVQQVVKHTNEALKDPELLLQTSARTFIPFVELGASGEYYRHDMYHLLGARGVNALQNVSGIDRDSMIAKEVAAIYQGMIDAYRKPGNEDAYVLVMLNYLDWKKQSDVSFRPYQAPKGLLGLTQDPYLAGLNQLKAEFKSYDICAEVYLAEAGYAVNKQQQVSALQLCDEAIALYPRYKRINALKNLKQNILSPELSVNTERVVYPDSELKLSVRHKNLDGFTVQLYKAKKVQFTQHFALLRPDNYRIADTLFALKTTGVGEYAMRIVPDTKANRNSESKLSVTRFEVLTRRLPGNQYEVVALDEKSGQPIGDATVALYADDEKVLQEFTTDSSGKVLFPWNKDYRSVTARKGTDTAMPLQNIYGGGYSYSNSSNRDINQVKLLTDRSLYRPGQTVYIKGIAYEQQSDTANVLPNKEYTLTLIDANRQEIGKKEVRTNEFGSFTADFTLPAACLNGSFSLRAGEGSTTTIQVEEYKRPTFDITFDQQKGSYKLGDAIQVKGTVKTYSGVSIQDVPLQYTVTRTRYSWWRMSEQTILASDTVRLGEDGNFAIPVRLTTDSPSNTANNPSNYETDYGHYTYQIQATVTNTAGETQTSTFSLSVGSRSLILGVNMNERICKDDSIKATFIATNLDRQPVAAEGTYQLYSLTNEQWKMADEKLQLTGNTPVYSGTFTANKAVVLDDWKTLPSGAYQLVLTAKDDQGREVTFKQKLILFSTKDTRPAVESPIWYYETNTSFDAAHPGVFYLGTSYKDAYVLMDVFCGDKWLESKPMQLSDSIVRFEYPYKEEYGNGLSVTFCLIKDGEIQQQQVRLEKRLADKNLSLKWDVFRDKLRPGQKEEWKLTIKTPQNAPAMAEMLATMYDASLDKIWKRDQSLLLFYNLPIPTTYWMRGYMGSNSFQYWFPDRSLKVPGLVYDRFMTEPMLGMFGALDEAVVTGYGTSRNGALVRGMSMMAKSAQKEDIVSDMASVAGGVLSEEMVYSTAESNKEPEMLPEATEELRTNFAETAFFYPQLRTNEQGEVSFSFTMPQSLTRWNFRGYAHTKGMLTGMIDAEATTSKEFMVTPNLPRFVRVGDKTSIAASIANLTGKAIVGTANFTLFDPMTEKIISTQKQQFTVEAGKTTGVSFLFTVTDRYDVLGCRLVADGGTFSDGEQHLLPVLSDKVNLTETVPMPIRGKQTRTFSLDSLFNRHSKTATNRSLTVEFTGNPAWYAVQALPALSLPTNDDAVSWASVYYANTLASYIMNAQPRIKAVFDSWKLQGGTKETFLSNLQKNQDVKNILLEESPWVMEAKTEEQQKERIATLFDLNNIRNNNMTALTKLKELQLSNGSWTWYKGMSGNRSITDFIVEMNARLVMLTGNPLENNALSMQQSAFVYLHKEALEEYQNIRKAEKEGAKVKGLSDTALKYLYLVAISGEKIPAANQAAYTYFLSKVNGLLTTQSMPTKALAAIVLDKAGRKQEAQAFMASLKEYLTQTDEQGMFFAFNENPYSWGSLKIPAHVDVMEAFERVSGNSPVVEEMKLWLLKQKQTQQWSSPVATVDAVYALLQQGTNLLDNQGDVRIAIGGQVMETVTPAQSTVPGLGYIKETFTEKKVVDARSIKVDKQDAGIAWGAVYAQYQENIDAVKQQGGELNVEKKLYVERIVNNVRQLQPITDKTLLAVGDLIVSRLTIRLDRAMEFVQLKDQRAACLEPTASLSGYRRSNGFGYYVALKDASTNFFFDGLGKGVHVLEYTYRVSRAGTYETGPATIQSAYAPEYVSHSASMKMEVK